MIFVLPTRALWANRPLVANGIITLLLAGVVFLLNLKYGFIAFFLVLGVLIYNHKGNSRSIRFADDGISYIEGGSPFKLDWAQIQQIAYSIKGYDAGWGDLVIMLHNGSSMVLSLDEIIATQRKFICYDKHIEKPLSVLCERHGVRFVKE